MNLVTCAGIGIVWAVLSVHVERTSAADGGAAQTVRCSSSSRGPASGTTSSSASTATAFPGAAASSAR